MSVYDLTPTASATQSESTPSNKPEPVASSKKKQIIGLIGCGLMIIGVFMPIISLPIVGSINYIYNGRGDGIIILSLAIISALLILYKLFRGVIATGVLSLLVMCFTLCLLLVKLNDAKSQLAQSNNLFKGIGEAMLATIQIQWGWLLLVTGGFLILASGLLKNDLRDELENSLQVNQKGTWSTLGAMGGFFALALIIASWVSPSFLRNVDVPSFNSQNGSQSLANLSSSPFSESKAEYVKGWQHREDTSEMDGKKTAVLYLVAENEIAGIVGQVRPKMIIRCRKGKTELFINTEVMIESDIWSNSGKVRVKFNDQQPVSQRRGTSQDRQALFAPNSTQLIKQLTTTQKFLFEFEPMNKGAEIVRFNVEGLFDQINKVAEACPQSKLK